MRRSNLLNSIVAVSPFDVLAVATIAAFWLVYTVLCYNKVWVGDVYVYVAGITQINIVGALPLHEASTQPASDSIVFTPYLMLVAALGREFGISPYRMLQHVGAFNVGLFVIVCLYFFHVFVGSGFVRASALFIVVCTILRGPNYSWSSELSVETLRLIQAYPSFFAWSAALLCFALTQRYLTDGHLGALLCVAPLLWFTILTHNLTGSWMTVVLCAMFVQALIGGVWPAFSERTGLAPANPLAIGRGIMGMGVLALTIVLALGWPSSNPLSAFATQPPENPPFSSTLLTSFPFLYALLVPAAFLGLRLAKRVTVFALLGFAATVAAYFVLRSASDYFERYIFFAAFFPQVILASSLAAISSRRTLEQFGVRGAVLALAFVIAAAALVVYEGTLRRFDQLRMEPGSRESFESNHQALFSSFRESDIVAACPVTDLTLHVFSHTGARFVFASSSQKGLERVARWDDSERLFAPDVSPQDVSDITRKYGITKLLVGPGCAGMGPALSRSVSLEPVSDGGWRVYVVQR